MNTPAAAAVIAVFLLVAVLLGHPTATASTPPSDVVAAAER